MLFAWALALATHNLLTSSLRLQVWWAMGKEYDHVHEPRIACGVCLKSESMFFALIIFAFKLNFEFVKVFKFDVYMFKFGFELGN